MLSELDADEITTRATRVVVNNAKVVAVSNPFGVLIDVEPVVQVHREVVGIIDFAHGLDGGVVKVRKVVRVLGFVEDLDSDDVGDVDKQTREQVGLAVADARVRLAYRYFSVSRLR